MKVSINDLTRYLGEVHGKSMPNFDNFKTWCNQRVAGIFLLNIFSLTLILLRSAGYFYPFFPLTSNLVIMLSIIFGSIVLKLNAKMIYGISIFFMILAGILRTMSFEIWAERSSIYFFQTFLLGSAAFIIEEIYIKFSKNDRL